MPRYDFKNIPANISIKPKQKSDTAILLDGKKYQEEAINTQFIKKIEYKNSSGSIVIGSAVLEMTMGLFSSLDVLDG